MKKIIKAYITSDKTLEPLCWAVQDPPKSFGVHKGREILQNGPWRWDTLADTRADSIKLAELLHNCKWKTLYRLGYRAHTVELFGVTGRKKANPIVGSPAWIKFHFPYLVKT